MKILFVCITTFLISTTVFAEDKIQLFKDYYYGMTRQQINTRGAINCSEVLESDDYNDALYLPNEVKFINHDWLQLFEFENDVLVTVKLITNMSPTAYAAASTNMIKNNYFPVMFISGKEQLYVPQIFKSLSQQDATSKLNEFEQKSLMSNDQFIIIFSDKDYFKKNVDKSSYTEFIKNAPIDLRMIELDVIEDFLALSFLPVGQIIAKSKNAIQSPAEKF